MVRVEIAQAVGDVIGSARIPSGPGSTRHSTPPGQAMPCREQYRAHRPPCDDAIGSGAEQWLGSAQEDSAVGEVVDGREGLLLAVAGSVDAFHGIERLVARDEILLRGFGGADVVAKVAISASRPMVITRQRPGVRSA